MYDSQIVYNHYRRVCLSRLVTQLVGEYVEGGPEDYGAPGRRVATLNWLKLLARRALRGMRLMPHCRSSKWKDKALWCNLLVNFGDKPSRNKSASLKYKKVTFIFKALDRITRIFADLVWSI